MAHPIAQFGPWLTRPWDYVKFHIRIIWALVMREVATRYGRDNIGFLWTVGEPLLFTGGVMIMWSAIRPPYDHGIRLVPFLITGYLPLILLRHTIGHGLNCIKSNAGLLYHRRITVLHLFVSRSLLEILSVTLAFAVSLFALIPFGALDKPYSLGMVYCGWLLMSWLAFGLTLILGSLAQMFEPLERIAMLVTYVMIPLTGAFFMVDWIPYQYRHLVLLSPLINCTEMIRGGLFGPVTPTYFNVPYTCACALAIMFIGLVLLNFVRNKIDVD